MFYKTCRASVLLIVQDKVRRIIEAMPGLDIRTFAAINIDTQLRSATARAEMETVFLSLDKSSMPMLADKHPTLAFKILWNIFSALSQRLGLTSAQLAEFLEANTL